jgi:AcrR family transcriptional regulator
MAKKKPEKTRKSLRRVPQQARGEQRVAKIVDAAATTFERLGYDNATTNSIARTAKTSIGSLYQFFPDKEALLAALTQRYRDQLRTLLLTVLSQTARQPLTFVFGQLVEVLDRFRAASPGFMSLLGGAGGSPALARSAELLEAECLAGLEILLAERLPRLTPNRRRLHALVDMRVIGALLTLASASEAPQRSQVLGELKSLLVAHAGKR